MNMTICSSLPAAEFPIRTPPTRPGWLARAHLDDLVAQLGHVGLTLQVHRAHVGPDRGRGFMVCAGPVCDGNSNLMMPVIAAAATITTPPRPSQSR